MGGDGEQRSQVQGTVVSGKTQLGMVFQGIMVEDDTTMTTLSRRPREGSAGVMAFREIRARGHEKKDGNGKATNRESIASIPDIFQSEAYLKAWTEVAAESNIQSRRLAAAGLVNKPSRLPNCSALGYPQAHTLLLNSQPWLIHPESHSRRSMPSPSTTLDSPTTISMDEGGSQQVSTVVTRYHQNGLSTSSSFTPAPECTNEFSSSHTSSDPSATTPHDSKHPEGKDNDQWQTKDHPWASPRSAKGNPSIGLVRRQTGKVTEKVKSEPQSDFLTGSGSFQPVLENGPQLPYWRTALMIFWSLILGGIVFVTAIFIAAISHSAGQGMGMNAPRSGANLSIVWMGCLFATAIVGSCLWTMWHFARVLEAQVSRFLDQLTMAQASQQGAARARAEFLSRVNTDIRTPLNNMLGKLHQVQDATQLAPEQRELVDMALESNAILNGWLTDFVYSEAGIPTALWKPDSSRISTDVTTSGNGSQGFRNARNVLQQATAVPSKHSTVRKGRFTQLLHADREVSLQPVASHQVAPSDCTRKEVRFDSHRASKKGTYVHPPGKDEGSSEQRAEQSMMRTMSECARSVQI